MTDMDMKNTPKTQTYEIQAKDLREPIKKPDANIHCSDQSGSLKGDQGGECNRTRCDNKDAQWFNRSTRKHYCKPCAMRIMSYPENAGLLTLSENAEM